MAYKLNGKFVSKEKYEAATVAEKLEAPVSTETIDIDLDVPTPKVRNVSEDVLATRRLTKAKRRVEKARAAAAKVISVQDELDAAEIEYGDAKSVVQELLDNA